MKKKKVVQEFENLLEDVKQRFQGFYENLSDEDRKHLCGSRSKNDWFYNYLLKPQYFFGDKNVKKERRVK